MNEQNPICRRCGKPVVVNKANFGIFEGMHWICFHLEYEHGSYDPDEVCEDPGCFWRKAESAEPPHSVAAR